MTEPASIPATRSDSSKCLEAASGVGSGRNPFWCGVSGSTPRSTPQRDEPTHAHPTASLLVGALVVLAIITAPFVWPSDAKARVWTGTTATWYGPGFYGNTFACGGTYRERTSRGVAHMRLPCGTRLTVCRRSTRRCVNVRVIDTGAFNPRHLDLTARTARDLIGCRRCRPYTQRIHWRRGWYAR